MVERRPVPKAPVQRRPPPVAPPPKRSVKFLPSGSFLLDCVLGGGWARGRMVNIVGDKSAGKTLLAIEACANFAENFSDTAIRYAEAEAAFDEDYARSIGMPAGAKMLESPQDFRTVEDLHNDLQAHLEENKQGPSLYVLDSVDSLSDEAEQKREIGDATYGAGKAKALSELFRRRIGDVAKADCTLMLISQIRDKIGVTFGETKTRSGGRALDFYASQIVWLAEIQKIKRTVGGIDRVVGVQVQARTKKNKVGPPFREAVLTVMFNYGIDDEVSMIEWLAKAKVYGTSEVTNAKRELTSLRNHRDIAGVQELNDALRGAVRERWQFIEDELAPPMQKYG